MNTLTVNYDGVFITVRRATVADNLNRMRLARKCVSWVGSDDLLDNLVWKWITLVTRTVSLEGVVYTLPSSVHSEAELEGAFNAFTLLDAVLVDKWSEAINQVNEPLNESQFAPMAVPDPNA